MKPTVELGYMANARALSGKVPSLDILVELLFNDVRIDGKDAFGPIISRWGYDLSEGQIQYVSNDAYATIKVYERLR